MSRYNKICCATTTKGKRCTKKKLFSNDFCQVHMVKPLVLCSICYETPIKTDSQKLKNCNHEFCKECINDWLLITPSCPNCRSEIDSIEKGICYFYGKKNNKIIDIKFIRYFINEPVLDEKLLFMEYFTSFFNFNQYYTFPQWTIIMDYLKSDELIHSIFLKNTTINRFEAVRVSDITQYIKKTHDTIFCFENSIIANNMQLFAIIKP